MNSSIMEQKTHIIPRSIAFLFFISFGMLLVSCAGTREANQTANTANPMVQEAEQAYKQIKADSLIIKNAPDELKKAAEAVKNAKNAAARGDQTSVKQLALLAKQRVQLAQQKAELKVVQKEAQHLSQEFKGLMQEIRQSEQDLIRSGQIKVEPAERAKLLENFSVRQTNRGLVLRFLNLSFGVGRTSLTSWAEQSIDELTNFLRTYPERTILIEGHTDSSGPTNLNKKLSQQRADFVRNALVARGIAKARISTIGLGEQHPLVSNSTETGRQRNRRVVVIISDKNGEIKARN